MLARTVNVIEGFFMMQYGKIMMPCNTSHQIHEQYIVVNGQVAFFKNRGTFKLVGCYFIMPGFNRNPQLVGFGFKFDR